MKKEKAIITAALSGAAPTREANPNVPHTPDEYVREAKRAEDAGAAIVHVHFREPDTGLPTTDPAVMQDVVQGIRENTNLILNLSTGVYPEAESAVRKRPIELHTPEIATLNTGTTNFCIVSHRDGQIIYDWTFPNPFKATIEFGTLMKEKGIKPELEVFAISHVHNVLFFIEHYDFLDAPLHFTFVFGIAGGVRFTPDILSAFIHAIPPGSTWQGLGVGPFCFPVTMASAMFGGHLRVGLEDNLYIDHVTKTLSQGNWDQVEKAVQIARIAGREVATVDEAREILNLPKK